MSFLATIIVTKLPSKKLHRQCISIISISLLSLQLGCATLVRGSNQKIYISSTPSGAIVTTSHSYICSPTPCFILVPRKTDFTLTVSKGGYEDYQIRITKGGDNQAGATSVGGNAITTTATSNVLSSTTIGGFTVASQVATAVTAAPAIAGTLVDLHTGAMNTLLPDRVEIELQKK